MTAPSGSASSVGYRTHWDGCWEHRGHHECAMAEIRRLRAEPSAESAPTPLRLGVRGTRLMPGALMIVDERDGSPILDGVDEDEARRFVARYTVLPVGAGGRAEPPARGPHEQQPDALRGVGEAGTSNPTSVGGSAKPAVAMTDAEPGEASDTPVRLPPARGPSVPEGSEGPGEQAEGEARVEDILRDAGYEVGPAPTVESGIGCMECGRPVASVNGICIKCAVKDAPMHWEQSPPEARDERSGTERRRGYAVGYTARSGSLAPPYRTDDSRPDRRTQPNPGPCCQEGAVRAHLRYLGYVVRHKWFVFVAGLKVGAPLWRLVIHDWSKFTPSEWRPYVLSFYGPWSYKDRPAHVVEAFDRAWLHHQHANPHHWQHWVLREDSGATKVLPMPGKFWREMIADWMGAGRAITGKWETAAWYEKNRDVILLHPRTRRMVEIVLRRHATLDSLPANPRPPAARGTPNPHEEE